MTNEGSKNALSVVVLNLHYTGLGVCRGLRGTGADVWGLSFDDSFLGNHSRHCHFSRYPNPAEEPESALQFFLDFAKRFAQPPLLLPTRDLDLEFLLRYRPQIESRYRLRLASSAVLDGVLNKARLLETARGLGIYCPREVLVTKAADLTAARNSIALPCIVKPVVASRWRRPATLAAVGGRKVVVFDEWHDVVSFYEQMAPHDPEMLVQEYIPGTDEDLTIFGSYISADRRDIRYFTAQKVLQSPPGSGTGIAVRARRIPDVADVSISLLEALRFTGISEIEFKRDPRSGRYALIEINARHWDQHLLGAAVGVNLTRALYADVTNQPIPPMTQDDRVVSWIAEEGYLIGLMDALRGRGYSMRQYLRPLWGPKTWATFDRNDTRPTLKLIRRVITEYRRAAAAALRRWVTPRSRADA